MIILISAKQQAGKTSLTESLLNIYPYSLYIKFAKPLYDIQNLIYKYLENYGFPYCEKDGEFLQFCGEHFRKKDKDIWMNIAKKQIQKFLLENEGLHVINDDCRHENEFDAFNYFSYPVARIRLECPENIRKERGGKLWRSNTTHPSEVGLDQYAKDTMFDFYIDTNKRSKNEVFEYASNALLQFSINGKFENKGDYESLFKAEQ